MQGPPIAGSIITALIVLAMTFGFWGLWALRIRSFTKVLKEPGPRAILSGGFFISLGFISVLFAWLPGLIAGVLAAGALATWAIFWATKRTFWAWTKSVWGRSLVVSGLSLALLAGILALSLPSPEDATKLKPFGRYCEYCESRHLVRGLSALQAKGSTLEAAWSSWRPNAPNNLQPSNAWSNLIFFLAGILAVSARPKEPLPWAFLVNGTLLTVGSFLFHATVSKGAYQDIDVAGIYGVLLAVMIYGIERAMAKSVPWVAPVRWIFFMGVSVLGALFVYWKEPLDKLGSFVIMAIFIVILLAISIVHIYVTFDEWQKTESRVVDHPAAHEVVTMIAPLLALVAAITIRTQDTSTKGLSVIGGGCPAKTDYGSPGLGVLTLFLMLTFIGLTALIVHFWSNARQRNGQLRRDRPDAWGGVFVPLVITVIFAVIAVPLLASVPSCQEKGWFNGHTWWHVLTGTALYLNWRFYDHHTPASSGDPVI